MPSKKCMWTLPTTAKLQSCDFSLRGYVLSFKSRSSEEKKIQRTRELQANKPQNHFTILPPYQLFQTAERCFPCGNSGDFKPPHLPLLSISSSICCINDQWHMRLLWWFPNTAFLMSPVLFLNVPFTTSSRSIWWRIWCLRITHSVRINDSNLICEHVFCGSNNDVQHTFLPM